MAQQQPRLVVGGLWWSLHRLVHLPVLQLHLLVLVLVLLLQLRLLVHLLLLLQLRLHGLPPLPELRPLLEQWRRLPLLHVALLLHLERAWLGVHAHLALVMSLVTMSVLTLQPLLRLLALKVLHVQLSFRYEVMLHVH